LQGSCYGQVVGRCVAALHATITDTGAMVELFIVQTIDQGNGIIKRHLVEPSVKADAQFAPGSRYDQLFGQRALYPVEVYRQMVLVQNTDTGYKQTRNEIMFWVDIELQECLFQCDLTFFGAACYQCVLEFQFGEEGDTGIELVADEQHHTFQRRFGMLLVKIALVIGAAIPGDHRLVVVYTCVQRIFIGKDLLLRLRAKLRRCAKTS